MQLAVDMPGLPRRPSGRLGRTRSLNASCGQPGPSAWTGCSFAASATSTGCGASS
jgi:hypothetical protein